MQRLTLVQRLLEREFLCQKHAPSSRREIRKLQLSYDECELLLNRQTRINAVIRESQAKLAFWNREESLIRGRSTLVLELRPTKER